MKKPGRNARSAVSQSEAVQALGGHGTESISAAIQTAMKHQESGRLAQAEACCRQILQSAPNQPDALHLLGVIAYQVGKNAIAVELLNRAISIKSSDPDYHLNLGNALQAQGKLDEAVASYRNALWINPDFAEAHNNLGT